MPPLAFLETTISSTENRLLSFIGVLLGLNSFFFVALQTSELAPFRLGSSNGPFYAGFVFLGIALLGIVFYYNHPGAWQAILRKILLTTFPAWFFLTYSLAGSGARKFHYLFQIAQSAYMMLAGLLLVAVALDRARKHQGPPAHSLSARAWFRRQGALTLLIVFVSTFLFFSFALIHLTKFAAVDEPLWYNGRIGKYWHNIETLDWKGTNISDKPGITVAWATGPGLWFKTPRDYKTIKYQGEALSPNRDSIESFYLAFRLPELIFITLFLPLFYFFLERLFSRSIALYAYALIATSPILIGMSKIINPDSLLWLFAPLSLLSYLLFLKKRFFRYLIFAGIFLGLALLTKYVANILFIFFIGLIFLEYLYHRPESEVFNDFLKRSFLELGILTYAAMATIYVFFPAVWIKPSKLLTATLESQAFEKITPALLMLLAFMFLDQFANRGRIVNAIIRSVDRVRYPIALAIGAFFGLSLLATLFISWNGMSPYHFSELLASPKTISGHSDFIGIFLTNFYPFIFGVLPVTAILLILTPLTFLKRNFFHYSTGRATLYLVLFILLYYLGATVNGVAMIVRYQIMLFPIAAIIAGITLNWLTQIGTKHFPLTQAVSPISIASILLCLGAVTLFITPFPLSYASILLPGQYHTNVKDMGSGSYEAAQYLNTLPNAENLLIWTDKDGVCKFFIGRCKRGRNYEALRQDGLDYIVVSSDRKNRTTNMMSPEIINNKPGLIRFDQYYIKPNPLFELNINGRPSQYVRVHPFVGY